MIQFKACERCKGDMMRVRDMYGDYVQCLQCGHVENIQSVRAHFEVPRTAVRSRAARGSRRPSAQPRDRVKITHVTSEVFKWDRPAIWNVQPPLRPRASSQSHRINRRGRHRTWAGTAAPPLTIAPPRPDARVRLTSFRPLARRTSTRLTRWGSSRPSARISSRSSGRPASTPRSWRP